MAVSVPSLTERYSLWNTGSTASLKRGFQSRAPRWAVVLQLEYIQSMPFSATRRIRLWVSSSTVSLKASLGVCPFSRSTSYWASITPARAPMRMPRSPVRSLYTSASKVVGNRYPEPMAMPTARVRSAARPVASWNTA